MHQQSIAYKAFRGPQMCPDRAIKPRTALHSERDEANAFTNNARLFFSLVRQPHFSVKQHKKWQRHHPAEAVAVRERGSTKEQLMRNCRCIIAEHAAGAAQPGIKKQLMPHKCAWHA